MISQLLATIMMALGVASGTKSTSNTFYDAEKPQPKRAETEVVPISINKQYERLQTYNYQDTYYNVNSSKYCIANNGDTNYYTGYMLIQNTQYSFIMSSRTSTTVLGITYCAFEISNYYNSQISVNLELNIQYNAQVGNVYDLWKNAYEYSNTDMTLIDRTLTSTTQDQLGADLNTNATLVFNNHTTITDTNNVITIGLNSIILQAQQTYKICFKIETNNANTYQSITELKPTSFDLQGTAVVPVNNQEIVDIPGIMFSIITMPFSFISQAFNLTIFPNTPYQVNFANLFLVLLAVFILLWIIKKVFK